MAVILVDGKRNWGNGMGSIRHEIVVNLQSQEAWAAVRDVGAVHRRLLPGRVVDTIVDGDIRTLVMPDGHRIRELIVDVDDDACRLAYCVVAGARPALRFHAASMQVVSHDDGRCRLVWVTDFLPTSAAVDIRARMERGAAEMKQALEESLHPDNSLEH
jgi:hypothetical protein